MFFKKLIGNGLNNKGIIFFLMLICLIPVLVFIFYKSPKGNIEIKDDVTGTGFTVDMKKFNSTNEYELFLTQGDVIQVNVEREAGKIGLVVIGKNGAEPYVGNDIESMTFTITISQTDNYVFTFRGITATGKITIKKVQ